MRIAYNPLYKPDGKTKVGALTSAPINDIVFDLPGKSIWAKGLKFLGTDSLKIIIGSSSDTVAGTWTGQHSEIGRYEDGLTIIYIPKVAGASTTTLNINGLGAKTCYYSGNSKLTTHYSAGTPILFTYYNDGWRRADYDSNTNYYRPIEVNDTSLLGNNNYVLNFKSDGNISYITTAATSTSKQADLTIGINILTLKNNLGVSTIINNTSTNDLLPTSKSVYDFVGTYLTSYMHWKGNTPSSGTTFTIPNVASVGDAYRIAVAGILPAANSITGSAQVVEVGDIIICTDATGPKYTVTQTNWTTVAGTSALAWNSEVTLATIGGLAIKAKLPTNPTLALKSISFTKADGTAVSYNGSAAVDLTGGINYATLANLVRNNLIIKLNGGTTEGTNLFTYNGSAAKTLNITPASIGAAISGHTHTTTIAASTDTNQIALIYGGKYKLTAGGTSYVFTMPASDNTWRPIGTGATDAAAGNHVHKNLIIKWGAGDTEGTNLFTYNGSTAKTIDLSIPFSLLFTNFSNAGSLTTRITIGGVTKDLKIDADTVDGLHANSFVRSYNSSGISGDLKGNYIGMSTSSGITLDWWHILCGAWNDEFRWNSLLALPTLNRRGLYYRSGLDNNTTFGSWIRVADADGTGASGTWGINITGNAATATNANKLDGIDSTGFLRYYNSNAAPSNVNIVNTPSYVWTVSTSGGSVSTVTKPSGIDNAWGVIHLHTHYGNYATQLGFGGTTNRMYMRNAYDSSTFGNWQALAFTSDIPTVTNYYWANIKVSTTSSTATLPTFNTCYTSNWFRSTGSTGWYNESFSGGWYQTDSDQVRVFNNKVIYNDGTRTWGIGGHYVGLKLYQASHVGINLANNLYTWGIYSNSNGNMYIGRRNGNVNDSSGTYYHILSTSYIQSPGFYHSGIGSNDYVNTSGGSYKRWTTANTANALIARDGNGYVYAGYYNSAISNEDSMTINHVYCSNDNWIRRASIGRVRSVLASEMYWANLKITTSAVTNATPTLSGFYWNPGSNIYLNQSSNNQEWSFDITRNGYTGGYWHVWDSSLSSILRVWADTGIVDIPYKLGVGTTAPTEKLHINNGLIRIDANSRYLRIGPQNSSHVHYETNADVSHWFNKRVDVNGAIWRYGTNYGIDSDGRFYSKEIYANRDGSYTLGGVSLYHTSDPMTYGIAFRGTGTYGTHGWVTGDWSTYLTMSSSDNRGWIFRREDGMIATSISTTGNMRLSNNFWNDGHIARGNEHIISPKGGSYSNNSSSITGYIIIRFPYSLIYTMMSLWIDVYSYSTNKSFTVQCGAYTYDNSFGHAPFAMCIGAQHKVRYCYDSNYYYIVVGESNSSWSYPKFMVRDMLVGYSRTVNNWINNALYCYIDTTLPGTEFSSITRYAITTDNIGSLSVNYANSAGNADTVDNLHASAFARMDYANNGNLYANHFYENSDIRYKEILSNLTINTNTIANLPLFDFKWKENNSIGTGTSAQAVQEILPNLVSGTDKLTLDYGVLGTVAGITACKELVNLKSEIDLLKERIELLEQQLKMYHGNSK